MKRSIACAGLVIVLAMILCISVDARNVDGHKKGLDRDGFIYLDRFAYDKNPVEISQGRQTVGWAEGHITLQNPDDFSKDFTLWQYTDNFNDWPNIYEPSDITCQERVLRSGANTHQKLIFDENGKVEVKLHALGGVRSRFHYFALVHCGGFSEFNYDLHFYRESSNWTKEFGVNESGLNTFYIIFFIFYVFFVAACAWNIKCFRSKSKFIHPIIKLFSISVICSFINILSELIHWGAYTTDGYGHPWIWILGDFIEVIGSTSFLLLLMLLSHGWAISSGLQNSNLVRRNIVAGATLLYGVFKVTAVFLRIFKHDPAKVGVPDGFYVFWIFVLIYEAVFGGYYIFSLFKTLRQESNPVKRSFMKWLSLFVLYILATAFTAVISFALDPWVRELIIAVIAVLALFLAQAAMLYLLWYTHSTQYFELENPSELVHDDLNYENF